MRVQVNFDPRPEGGTHVRYQTWMKTGNLLAQVGIPFAIGIIAKNRFGKALRVYDRLANKRGSVITLARPRGLNAKGRARFKSLSETVIQQGTDPALMTHLEDFLDKSDELSIQRIRPYALADHWEVDRRAVLEMCLRATRAGILDMSWDLLCPSCRGTTEGHTNLGDVRSRSHCSTCQIDFTVNFDHNIEVVFRPNPSVRAVELDAAFCVGSPQLQPHVVMAQSVSPLHSLPVNLKLEPGRYTLRASNVAGSVSLLAEAAWTCKIGPACHFLWMAPGTGTSLAPPNPQPDQCHRRGSNLPVGTHRLERSGLDRRGCDRAAGLPRSLCQRSGSDRAKRFPLAPLP